jgi:para-nitrobenzyl esterase
VQREEVSFFGGIPFAAPPVGNRRWRAPAPAAPWTHPRDASAFGPDCPQPIREGRDATPQSEDCLTLSIATPNPSARKLPVLVSIHGGAYFAGSGRELFAHGVPPIVKQGVVVVAPNYRLGRLGFFSYPALTREAPRANSNYWLMDQVAALKWVRRNIARFGGDPDNVTIIGCSAGGSSVNALVASPQARGLFARASAHSGGGLFNANRPLPQAEEQGVAFARRVGIAAATAAGLAQLRGLTVADVLRGDPGPPDFGAVVDGTWLKAPIAVSFSRGDFAHVPLMTGSTSNEASVFGLMGFGRETLERRFHLNLGALAPAYGPLAPAEFLRQVQTDFIFTAPAMAMTQLAARADVPAWSYHFNYVASARREQQPGANHCEDMGYWLGALQNPSADDERVAIIMQQYLLNYVRDGDPNRPGLPAWPRVVAGNSAPLVIDPGGFHIVRDFRSRQLLPLFAKWQDDTGQSLGFAGTVRR